MQSRLLPSVVMVVLVGSSFSCTLLTGGMMPKDDNTQMAMARGMIAFGMGEPQGPQHIFLANIHGNIVKELTHEDSIDFFPAWSPDGKKIAFTSDRGSRSQMWGMDTVHLRLIAIRGEEEGVRPALEIGTSQIWVMNADGSEQARLTWEGANAHPAWSPDGKRIAFSSTRTGKVEIWVMNADGSDQKQLTETSSIDVDPHLANLVRTELIFHGLGPDNQRGITNLFPSWSPDGGRIVFCSTRGGAYAVWVTDSEGTDFKQITYPLGDRYPYANIPIWSPRGDKIAFWSGMDLGPGSIWVMNPDGSNRTRVTDQPDQYNCDEPTWSPDGSKILYSTNRPGSEGTGVWITDVDGSNQHPFVTNLVHGRPRASWQPVVIEK